MRDADPSAEIALWISLIGVARRFCEVNPAADFKDVLKSMLHISMGAEPPMQEV